MSQVSLRSAWRNRLLEAGLAVGLGLLLLVLSAWQSMARMGKVSADWTSLIASLGLKLDGTPLGDATAAFIFFQLLLHAGFGLVCWLLAIVTVRAFPDLHARRRWTIVAWAAIATLWVLVGNATLFPWSGSGFHADWFARPLAGGVRLFDLSTLILLAVVGFIALRNVATLPRLRRVLPRLAAYSVLALCAWNAIGWMRDTGEAPRAAQGNTAPNIILIGVDSLRRDAVGQERGVGVTPNIDVFLRDGAHTFNDAVTPLARTFASWTAILSGRNPRSTGARENLVALSSLKKFETVAGIARSAGYHTVYATDEVRFSNIDASYGFDQVITPTIGVADFLLGKANDLPLANLVANTRLAKWWFPATYGNRAAAHTYRPETFVGWLDDDLDDDLENGGPTFLAVHLTLPHVPYHWADSGAVFGNRDETSYQYAAGVIAADRQFGAILEMLERKQLLNNALVVLLSDHGEALGIPHTDSMLRGAVARDMLDGERISLWGHGSSVLSPNQYAVVLAMRGYGSAELPPARQHDEPVSLVDIAPTVLDLAGIRTTNSFDGMSLRPLIEMGADAGKAFAARPRFTETGFRTPLMMDGHFDETSVVGAAAPFFVMNPQNARLEVRPNLMPRLIADKERAVLSADWLLAAIPAGDRQKYVLVSRRGEGSRRLESAPPATDAEAYPLWQAMHEHYGEEMLEPAPRVTLAVARGD